jgi:dihydroxy-acid dehydratase
MAPAKRRPSKAASASGARHLRRCGLLAVPAQGLHQGGGYSDDALDRPIVGITNTFSDYNPCHGNVPDLIEAVKRGVMLAGALPMVFPTVSIHESFSHPTSMFLRNLMAMDTEEMIRAQPMDAVVLIGGCDKTLPAQLMAAASADLPAPRDPVGPMLVGHFKGEVLGACTDCRRLWGQYRAGDLRRIRDREGQRRLAPTKGTCMVMGTASTMGCIEALGMGLPMSSGSIPATHADRLRIAEQTGRRRGRDGGQAGPKPSEIMTKAAFRNALTVLQAIGGSTNGWSISPRSPPARHRDRPGGVRRDRPQRAGAGRSEAVRRSLHGALPLGRRQCAKLMKEIGRTSTTSCRTVAGRTLKRGRSTPPRMVPGQTVIRTAGQPDQADRRHGRAARQPRAARRRDQACGGLAA